jgi:hypothetical protein
VLLRKPEGKVHAGDLSVDGMIMLKCILKKYSATAWTGIIPFRRGSSSWLFKHGNDVETI